MSRPARCLPFGLVRGLALGTALLGPVTTTGRAEAEDHATPTTKPVAKNKAMKAADLVSISEVAFGHERFATAHALHGQQGVALWEQPNQAHTQPTLWLSLPTLPEGPGHLALSPDGNWLLVVGAASGGTLLLVNTRTGATQAELTGRFATLAWSRDGKWFAAAGQDQAAPPPGARTHPDKAVSYSTAGRIRIYAAASANEASSVLLGPEQEIVSVAFVAERRVIGLYKEGALASFVLKDEQNGKPQKTVDLYGRGHALAVSPDGRQIATVLTKESGESRVELLDAATLARTGTLEGGPKGPIQLSYSSDGAQLAVVGFGGVQVWDLKTATLRATLDEGAHPRGAMFMRHGLVVVGGEQALWQLYDHDLKKIRVTVGPPRLINAPS